MPCCARCTSSLCRQRGPQRLLPAGGLQAGPPQRQVSQSWGVGGVRRALRIPENRCCCRYQRHHHRRCSCHCRRGCCRAAIAAAAAATAPLLQMHAANAAANDANLPLFLLLLVVPRGPAVFCCNHIEFYNSFSAKLTRNVFWERPSM